MTPYDRIKDLARRLKDMTVHEKVARPRDRRFGAMPTSGPGPLEPVTTSLTLTSEPAPDGLTN